MSSQPLAAECDESDAYLHRWWDACASAGLLRLVVDPAFGGRGDDALSAVVAMEALGRGCTDHGLMFSLNAHLWSVVAPISRFGTQQQREKYLPGLIDGSLIGGQAMTEPDHGSDAFGLTTSATEQGDEIVLSGSKTFTTNAPVADVLVVFATTDRSKGWAGISGFLVDRDTPGLWIGPRIHKTGLGRSPMAEVHLDDCRIPATSRVGEPGGGMAVFNHSMGWERSCILATAVGAMQRQVSDRRAELDAAPGRAGQRALIELGEMATGVQVARLLLYRAAWLRSLGKRSEKEASLVKLFVSEHWMRASLDQLEQRGADGLLDLDEPAYDDVRDSVASRIYSGTSDIQRNLIAQRLGL